MWLEAESVRIEAAMIMRRYFTTDSEGIGYFLGVIVSVL